MQVNNDWNTYMNKPVWLITIWVLTDMIHHINKLNRVSYFLFKWLMLIHVTTGCMPDGCKIDGDLRSCQSREHQKMISMYVAYEDFSRNPSKYNI